MKIALIAHDKKKDAMITLASNTEMCWRLTSFTQQAPRERL